MRLAATTYSFRDLPLPGALDAVAGAGLRDVEVWLGHADGPERAVLEELARRGLRAVAVSAGGVYAPGDDAVGRGAQLALVLGAPVVVACVAPGLLPSLVAALDPRVTLCLEQHWNQPVARASHVLRELKAAPRVMACLDTGHALAAGDEPAAFARAVGARLGHVHLKEGVRAPRLARLAGPKLARRLGHRAEWPAPGRGDLRLAPLARTLHALGYGGAVSIEVEGDDAAEAVASVAAAWRASALD